MICEYCLEKFKTKDLLQKHSKESTKCIKYKNILFTCKNCNYSTVGIKNIDMHIKTCKNDNSDNDSYELISDDEDENEKLKILNRIENKLDSLIKNNIKVEKSISSMPVHFIPPEEKVIQKRKTKNKEILQKNLSEIENIDHVIIKDEFSKIIEDISHFNNISQKSSPSSIPFYKKNSYKTLKNIAELTQELSSEEMESRINIKKEELESKKNTFLENIKKSENIFKECFDSIKQTRNYTKSLDAIKKVRLNLIECMPFDKYLKLLQNHQKILENMFSTLKEFPKKKMIDIISKSLNTIDTHFLTYGSYINTLINIDDIQRFKRSLMFFNVSYPNYIPLVKEDLFKKFFNYGTALFSLKDMIEMFIPNYYGFNNIIYVAMQNSKTGADDPFSFYILEDVSIVKKVEKRYWKMDCRLEEFTNSFTDNIKTFLVENFRKFYYNIFNDNEFRKDYMPSNCITEYECEQLLQSIYLLCQPKKFNLLLRNVIKDNCSYIPTPNDKFNLYADDTIQKKKFLNRKEDKEIIIETVKILFDNITSEDATDFCSTI